MNTVTEVSGAMSISGAFSKAMESNNPPTHTKTRPIHLHTPMESDVMRPCH
jgi:hypothetical protein